MLVSGAGAHLVHEVIAEAIGALVEWLREGWISAPGGISELERAEIKVTKDWYGPFWSVQFKMDGPPWFGDTISIEVEEIGPGAFSCSITDPASFHRTNIHCDHPVEVQPRGHWKANQAPRPRICATGMKYHQGNLPGLQDTARAEPGEPLCFFAARPRDLGWADSRHWMEEE